MNTTRANRKVGQMAVKYDKMIIDYFREFSDNFEPFTHPSQTLYYFI